MKRLVMGMLVLACMSLVSGAFAVPIQTIDVYAQAPTPPALTPNVPWLDTIQIDKFDPERGTLRSVHVWVCGKVYGDMGFEHKNPNGPASFFDLFLQAEVKASGLPGVADFDVTLGQHENESPVAAYDLIDDLDGLSGSHWTVKKWDCDYTLVDESFFPQYIGPGQLDILCESIGLSTFITPPGVVNYRKVMDTYAKAKIHIAYDYEPKVPELNTLALASLGGFVGFPLFRRFKK